MAELKALDKGSLETRKQELDQRYKRFQEMKLTLDMTRGKPCAEQLDLSNELLTINQTHSASGIDCRNYGGIEGIPEARSLFAEVFELPQEQVFVCGNSSLALMFETVARGFSHGFGGTPFSKLDTTIALCPAPGYDRHFRISQHFGMKLETVSMLDEGPDMDYIERRVAEDESIKLLWLNPRYSNPTGVTLSDAVVRRLATMKTKAPDFRIIWDDAYAIHHLGEGPDPLCSILDECKAAGNEDRVFVYGSTSKITFAGAGVSFVASSVKNMQWLRSHMFVQTIGYDKLNMLRHVLFFQNRAGMLAHMDKHAKILKPKFEAIETVLERELGGLGIAVWTKPRGGYFTSLDTLEGCATKVVSLAKAAGVALTEAGATFPYGKDPRDTNIRLAPSFPDLKEVTLAMEIVAVCIQLASVEKLLAE